MENELWEEGAPGGAVTKLLQLSRRKMAGLWLRAVTVEMDRRPDVVTSLITVTSYMTKVTLREEEFCCGIILLYIM